jgi:hypothetical protein
VRGVRYRGAVAVVGSAWGWMGVRGRGGVRWDRRREGRWRGRLDDGASGRLDGGASRRFRFGGSYGEGRVRARGVGHRID